MSPRLIGFFSYLVVGAVSLMLSISVAKWILRPAVSQTQVVPPPVEVPVKAPVEVAKPITQSEVSFIEPYVFDLREGRRNPFQVPLLSDGSSVEVMVPGTPLERYEVDELKLVGILWDVRAPKAMFIDPVGEVHVLSKDDRIGRRRGYVAVIREGEVVIVEASTFGGDNAFATRVLRIER